jgi:ribosomal protein S18 acetylase RimI-like enzyme
MAAEQYQLTVEQEPDPRDSSALVRGLVSYNDSRAEPENYRPLAVFLRDADGQIVGGVLGQTNWGWLFISHVWLAEHLRGEGFGRQLLAAAEREAFARGCRHAHLDTFSFQAPDFYQQLGYEVFGVLDDYPAGHRRYYLRKRDLRPE